MKDGGVLCRDVFDIVLHFRVHDTNGSVIKLLEGITPREMRNGRLIRAVLFVFKDVQPRFWPALIDLVTAGSKGLAGVQLEAIAREKGWQ